MWSTRRAEHRSGHISDECLPMPRNVRLGSVLVAGQAFAGRHLGHIEPFGTFDGGRRRMALIHRTIPSAIARLRRQGKTDHLGRKRKVLGAKLETVRQLHRNGLSLRKIAARGHATAMTVQRIIQREQRA